MTEEEFLPLNLAKGKSGIPLDNSDLDAQIMIYRKAAIARIESTTRRNIVTREVTLQSPDIGNGKNPIRFFAHDIIAPTESVDVTYRTSQDDPGFVRDGTLSIHQNYWEVKKSCASALNSTAENGPVSDWPDRDYSVYYEAELQVGIPAGEAPPEFQAAALFLIKELIEGSALDELPHNIIDLLLRDHIMPPITKDDCILSQAGVE